MGSSIRPLQLMQLSLLLHLDVDDSLSLEGLAHDVNHFLASPGSDFIDMYPDDVLHVLGSPGSSFIDMYHDELFSVRRTTASARDVEFELPVVNDGTASPVLMASPSRFFCGGLLLPCEPGNGKAAQEHGDDGADVAPSVPQRSDSSSSPQLDLLQRRTPAPSSCFGAMRDAGSKLGSRQTTVCACGSSSFSPPWKVLPSCWRFSGTLCRKVSAQRLRPCSCRDVVPASACPTLGSKSSAIERCHGSANTAVHDAILYCKKSSGQDVLSD